MSSVGEAFTALAREESVSGARMTGLQLITGFINRIDSGMEGWNRNGKSQTFLPYVVHGLRRHMPEEIRQLGAESGFEAEMILVINGLLNDTPADRALFLANIKTSLELEPAGASSEADTTPAPDLGGGPN